jgi:hypothetical protein
VGAVWGRSGEVAHTMYAHVSKCLKKVVRYKISTQRSVSYLYTNTEMSEKEIKKPIPLAIA